MADVLAEMAQTVGGMPCTAPVLLTEEEVRSNSPSGDVQNIETSDLHAGRSHKIPPRGLPPLGGR